MMAVAHLKIYNVENSQTGVRLIFHNSRGFFHIEVSDYEASKLHALLAQVVDPWAPDAR